MRIILFCEQKYAISILRPIDLRAREEGGHEILWYVHRENIPTFPLEKDVRWTSDMQEVYDFSPEAIAVLKTCMAADAIGSWRLYGKTGTGRNHYSHFLEGWYVGFLENPAGEQIFFAAHGADPQRNLSGPEIRDSIRHLLPAVLSTTAKYPTKT